MHSKTRQVSCRRRERVNQEPLRKNRKRFLVLGFSQLSPPPKNKDRTRRSLFFWWSRCRHRRTPLLSFGFAFKCFFNIVKRDIVDAQRLLACVDDYSEMVIVQVDRVYEDVDECSALIEVIHRHFADKIKKGIYLRFGQTDLLVILNGELSF